MEDEPKKEDKSIKELLNEMNEKLDKKKDNKFKFRLPFGKKVGKRQAKKGFTTVMVIKDNRNIVFEKHPIDEQTIVIDGVPRIASTDNILFYKGKPVIIQPSWSTKPFSPTDNLDETTREQYSTQGHRLLLNRMQNEVIKPKRSVSWLLIIIGIVAAIALGYFAFKGGLFK